MVVIVWPCTAAAGIEHARAAVPLICTVHAPHAAIPQPNFVPVSPSDSRNTHSNGVSSSTTATRKALLSQDGNALKARQES